MNGGPLIMHFNVCFSKRVSNVKESAFNDLWNWALAFLTFKSFWLLFSKGNVNIMGPKDFMHTDLPKLGISVFSGKMAPAGGGAALEAMCLILSNFVQGFLKKWFGRHWQLSIP